MLSFDENGFLKPYEAIPATMELLVSEFVGSFETDSRRKLFEKLEVYLNDLKSLVNVELIVWVNGSFVTRKSNPRDIDVVTFIPWQQAEQFSEELKRFSKPSVIGNYGVDGYLVRVYQPEQKLHILTQSDRVHWLFDFTRTQPDRSGKRYNKGYLEIKF